MQRDWCVSTILVEEELKYDSAALARNHGDLLTFH